MLDDVRALRKRLRSFGIDINRVTLPTLTRTYIDERVGAEEELENAAKALEVYGQARIPIARQRTEGDVFPQMMEAYSTQHRGGYLSRGGDAQARAGRDPVAGRTGTLVGALLSCVRAADADRRGV